MCVCVWTVIGGVIGMAAFIRFKNDVASIKNASAVDLDFEHVTFHHGFKLHTAAWILSLLAFLKFVHFVVATRPRRPSEIARLAMEAVGTL